MRLIQLPDQLTEKKKTCVGMLQVKVLERIESRTGLDVEPLQNGQQGPEVQLNKSTRDSTLRTVSERHHLLTDPVPTLTDPGLTLPDPGLTLTDPGLTLTLVSH